MSRRKLTMFLVFAFVFGVYMIIMDPFNGSKLIEDIPFGYTLLFKVNILLLSSFLIILNNVVMDMIVDDEYKIDDRTLAKLASANSTSAATLLLAKAIRYVSSSIIIFGVLYYCSGE